VPLNRVQDCAYTHTMGALNVGPTKVTVGLWDHLANSAAASIWHTVVAAPRHD